MENGLCWPASVSNKLFPTILFLTVQVKSKVWAPSWTFCLSLTVAKWDCLFKRIRLNAFMRKHAALWRLCMRCLSLEQGFMTRTTWQTWTVCGYFNKKLNWAAFTDRNHQPKVRHTSQHNHLRRNETFRGLLGQKLKNKKIFWLQFVHRDLYKEKKINK